MYTAEWYIAKDNKPSDRGLINAQHWYSSEGKGETHEKLEPGWPVCAPRFELGILKHKSAGLPLCPTRTTVKWGYRDTAPGILSLTHTERWSVFCSGHFPVCTYWLRISWSPQVCFRYGSKGKHQNACKRNRNPIVKSIIGPI